MVFYLFCQGIHIPNVFPDTKWRLESTDLAKEIEKRICHLIIRVKYLVGDLEERDREKQGQLARQMERESDEAADSGNSKNKQNKHPSIQLLPDSSNQHISSIVENQRIDHLANALKHLYRQVSHENFLKIESWKAKRKF